ncbi:hypothetical protein Asppvi_009314 [Aspergillus pseudoviridinutans]|uniref:Rhodopsin domain-containing protein n=1 Tax=Aspergillus pseudoviridinutans TaxID=1517512 RepID=A0A9P3BJA6_9EURO|nr:uncharacterized protein Asppvi_009314 [Aspergillus pseudoviridinutans]GIJ90360.1 hypothetical protein Asppvi_009314 [Aspergillus pseudoviridinutans]
MAATFRHTHHFTPEEIRRREIASKFVLANRVFYNSYLWLQKLVLLDTYRRLHTQLRWEKVTVISYISIFLATYVIVQIVTFTECDPFNHYWIVLPDPGTCCQAQLQLIVLGVLNVITDVMLIAMPIPILVVVKRSTVEKFQLMALFTVGLFIVAITIARLPQNTKNATEQVNRTTWASIELLAAAIVANAPVLYGLLKGTRQKSKYAAAGAGSAAPSWPGRQKRSANESEFELQGAHHSNRGSVLGSKISSSNYLEIDGESGSPTSVTNRAGPLLQAATAAAGAVAGVFGVGKQMMGGEECVPDDSAPDTRLSETVGLGNDAERLAEEHARWLEVPMLPLPVARSTVASPPQQSKEDLDAGHLHVRAGGEGEVLLQPSMAEDLPEQKPQTGPITGRETTSNVEWNQA